MSNNIDTVRVLTIEASMRAADVAYFYDVHEDDLCESAFLHDLVVEARAALRATGPDTRVVLKNLNWCGEGSGSTYDFFIKEVCPKIRGHVGAVLIYESGHMVGLDIVNGNAVECDVEFKLVPKKVK